MQGKPIRVLASNNKVIPPISGKPDIGGFFVLDQSNVFKNWLQPLLDSLCRQRVSVSLLKAYDGVRKK